MTLLNRILTALHLRRPPVLTPAQLRELATQQDIATHRREAVPIAKGSK